MPPEEQESDNTIVALIDKPVRGEGMEDVGDGRVEVEGEIILKVAHPNTPYDFCLNF